MVNKRFVGCEAGRVRVGVLMAAVVVIGAGVGYVGLKALSHKTASASTSLSYWTQTAAANQPVAAAIRAAGSAPLATTDRTKADLIITTSPSSGATGILPASTATPAALTAEKIVTATTKPTYYASVGPSSAKTSIASKVISRLAATTTSGTPWTMDVVGDIGLGRSVYTSMVARGSFVYPFAAFRTELRSADLSLANLEGALSDKHAVIGDNGMTFVSPFRAAGGLTDSGIDAVSVANNHSFNGGAAGYLDTIAQLNRLGIAPVGGGGNEAEAHSPQILTVKGQKVALLAYSAITGSQAAGPTTPGMAFISMAPWGPFSETDVSHMEADIKAAHTKADLVFVYFHWGTEYTHDANADQRTVAHRAIDAGADLVLGAHPHWVQGVEWYHNHLIAYSLGNFIFDQPQSTETKQGTMLKVVFSGNKLQSAELVPYEITDAHEPQPASAAATKQILGDVFTHSWWPSPLPQ